MKEAQMSGKGDWKAKSELEEARKAIEQLKEDKKKIESKLKAEVESLRKKLEEETSKNKLLSEQVRQLEYGQLMQKEQMKEFAK
jgi:predicted RNase H-like nuclease (RuvC/YqgF family)